MQKVIMESMTDGKGMPRVVSTPGAPAFDYKAEADKAKSNQSPELKALLEEAKKPGGAIIRPPKTAAPPPGEENPPPPKVKKPVN